VHSLSIRNGRNKKGVGYSPAPPTAQTKNAASAYGPDRHTVNEM